MLEAVYGFLTLKNGVPIGYVLASSLFESTEVAYNVFDTYRGAEAAPVFGRVLAMMPPPVRGQGVLHRSLPARLRQRRGAAVGRLVVLLQDGIPARGPGGSRVLRGELAPHEEEPAPPLQSRPRWRSWPRSTCSCAWTGRGRRCWAGWPWATSACAYRAYLAGRFGADREAGLRACSREAAGLLGLRSQRGFSSGERLAWERWSPLVLSLPGLSPLEPAGEAGAGATSCGPRAGGARRSSSRASTGTARLRRAVLQLTEDLDQS